MYALLCCALQENDVGKKKKNRFKGGGTRVVIILLPVNAPNTGSPNFNLAHRSSRIALILHASFNCYRNSSFFVNTYLIIVAHFHHVMCFNLNRIFICPWKGPLLYLSLTKDTDDNSNKFPCTETLAEKDLFHEHQLQVSQNKTPPKQSTALRPCKDAETVSSPCSVRVADTYLVKVTIVIPVQFFVKGP